MNSEPRAPGHVLFKFHFNPQLLLHSPQAVPLSSPSSSFHLPLSHHICSFRCPLQKFISLPAWMPHSTSSWTMALIAPTWNCDLCRWETHALLPCSPRSQSRLFIDTMMMEVILMRPSTTEVVPMWYQRRKVCVCVCVCVSDIHRWIIPQFCNLNIHLRVFGLGGGGIPWNSHDSFNNQDFSGNSWGSCNFDLINILGFPICQKLFHQDLMCPYNHSLA